MHSKKFDKDIEKIRQLLHYKKRDDLLELLSLSHSKVQESSQFGTRLHSLISTFEIYSPIGYTVKLRNLSKEDYNLILSSVKEVYPLKDHSPEIVDIEFRIYFNGGPNDINLGDSFNDIKNIVPTEHQGIAADFNTKDVIILRGGDWKIEGDQSVFYYKVKIENKSRFVINNIQIILTLIPAGLQAELDRYKINLLKPNSFESPTFKLNATQSCVGDSVEGIITYIDSCGNMQTCHIEPFKICYVCNLLTPKQISKQEFDEKIQFMEDQKLIIDSDVNILNLETKIEQIIKDCNFKMLEEIQTSQSNSFKIFEAYAQGLYDKQDVALSIALKKMGDGSKLVVKAMSIRSEKLVDLLRDFSIKLDGIKNDTELIKEYSSQIEQIFDNVNDLEEYLKDHLDSDWEKIKNAYREYKEKKINRKQFIGNCIKVMGKKFIKKIIEK